MRFRKKRGKKKEGKRAFGKARKFKTSLCRLSAASYVRSRGITRTIKGQAAGNNTRASWNLYSQSPGVVPYSSGEITDREPRQARLASRSFGVFLRALEDSSAEHYDSQNYDQQNSCQKQNILKHTLTLKTLHILHPSTRFLSKNLFALPKTRLNRGRRS